VSSKNTLTIEEYWNKGGDLNLDIRSFMIQERVRNSVKTVKLIVNRTPDKHSTRLGMFAFLHTRDGYQNLGFPEVALTIDKYSDRGKFISRKIYGFPDARIESSMRRGDEEELTFISSGISEFEISQVEVFFD
jgi:hypothetical protein